MKKKKITQMLKKTKTQQTNKQTPPESLPNDIFYCGASHECRAVHFVGP